MQLKMRSGESAVLYQTDEGIWCCPVCGSPEFTQPPYFEDGAPSFEMCSCGFEFGFDDDPGASKEAVEGVVNNWVRWRENITKYLPKPSNKYEQIKINLKNIGLEI